MSERFDIVLGPSLYDVPALAALHVRCWQQAYRDIMPADFLRDLSVERRAEQWSKTLADTEVFAPAARGGDAWVGFVHSGPSRLTIDEGEVYGIYVDEAWHGQGIGQTLIRMAFEDLSKQGFATAVLGVLRDNHRARRFYDAMGGAVVHEGIHFMIEGVKYAEVMYRFKLGKI